MVIREYRDFKYGVVNSIEARTIPAGAASAALNWITKGDKIELRRGFAVLGTELSGSGKVTGIHVGFKADGTEVLFRTRGRKVEYYDSDDLGGTMDWIEIGSNTLPAAADGEDVSFDNYQNLAGAQTWLSSPNSGLYKIMTANPGNIKNMYDSSKNFKGYIRIKQNRTFLINKRGGQSAVANQIDKTGVYGSKIDTLNFTTVTAESIGTGDGLTKTFSGTLSQISSVRTVFGLSITDGTETFTDDYSGVLTGSLGGTGTINYTTGAYSVTFNTAPANLQAITADYQYENATSGGIADFTKSSPRTAGEGFVFRQDDGGDIQSIMSIGNTEYCLHTKKAWQLTLTSDDTDATNYIYRKKVGIPNWRAAVETGDGIYYIDDSDENNPVARLLTFDSGSTEVIPVNKSRNVDFTAYVFDKAASIEWGDYILWSCRTTDSTQNNRVIIYNKLWKSWDIADWWVSCWAIFEGTLVAGDSISNNVYTVFSGLDDADALISNSWEGWESDLEIEGLKKSKKLVIQGEIGPDQVISVYADSDHGGYSHIGDIEGDGTYVDRSQSVNVGAVTIGRSEVGGGGSEGAIPAYNYMRVFSFRSDKFERIKLKFEATAIGYASVTTIRFLDVRSKGKKVPRKYR